CRQQEIGFDEDKASNVELQLGFDVDFPARIQHQTLRRRPVHLHAGIYGAFQAELATNLQASLGTHNGNAYSQATAHKQAQASVGRDVQLGTASDVGLVLVRRVVSDPQAQLL